MTESDDRGPESPLPAPEESTDDILRLAMRRRSTGRGEADRRRDEEPGAFPVLTDFRIVREIGRGGMGIVYEAHQASLDRRVAVKVLPPHVKSRMAAIERFLREATLAARLKHPGIVEIHAVGEERGTHYFAMAFVEGAPLNRVIERARADGIGSLSGESVARAVTDERHRPGEEDPQEEIAPVPPSAAGWSHNYIDTVVDIVTQVADALDHSHRAGVVHRDVKPANILVQEDGTARLTDFGLAWQEDLPSLTKSGEFAGTPHYTSPEQASLLKVRIDHRTDIYSLGATLYELLTLHRPFDGETSQEILHRIRSDEPHDPRRLNRRLPAELAAILTKALEKEPSERYATAADLAEDLRRFSRGEPVRARSLTLGYLARKYVSRNRMKIMVAAIVMLAVLLGIAATGYHVSNLAKIREADSQRVRDRVEALLEDGFLLLAEGSGRKAQARFCAALELAPNAPEAVAGAALASSRQDAPEEALALLNRHPELAAHGGIEALKARCLRALGRTAEADDIMSSLERPTSALGFFLAGQAALPGKSRYAADPHRTAADHFASAVLHAKRARPVYYFALANAEGRCRGSVHRRRIADAVVSLWPGSSRAWCARAYAFGRGEYLAQAIAACRESIRLDPEYAVSHSILGALLKFQGDFESAARAIREAIRLDPECADSHNNLGAVLNELGHLEAAADHLRTAIRLDARHAPAHTNLGLVLQKQGNLEGALESRRKATRLAPDSAECRTNLGITLLEMGRHEKARHQIREAIKLDEDHARAHYTLGQIHRQTGRPDLAVGSYEKAIRSNPTLALARINLGAALLACGKKPAAIAALREATECLPDHPLVRSTYGALLHHAGRLDEAMEEHRAALQLDGKLAVAHNNLGFTQFAKADVEGALASFIRATELDPTYATAHYNVGLAHSQLKHHEKAALAFREAIRLKPGFHQAHYSLANALDSTGDAAGAVAAYREVVRLAPKSAEARCNLGLVLQRLGDLGEALRELRAGHALGARRASWDYPSAKWVETCERRVCRAAIESMRIGFGAAEGQPDLDADARRRERDKAAAYLGTLLDGWPVEVEDKRATETAAISMARSVKERFRQIGIDDGRALEGRPPDERKVWRDLSRRLDAWTDRSRD